MAPGSTYSDLHHRARHTPRSNGGRMSHHPTPEQSALDAWLAAFASALEREDRQALASLFTEDADWRDIVAFTWDFSTAVGPEAIADRLLETNAETRASQVLPDLMRTP